MGIGLHDEIYIPGRPNAAGRGSAGIPWQSEGAVQVNGIRRATMKKLIAWATVGVAVGAAAASAATERLRFSNGNYNGTGAFPSYWPATAFNADAGKYPLYAKQAHFRFRWGGYHVVVKLWDCAGATPASVVASFDATTQAYPAWTDVDMTSAHAVFDDGYFAISVKDRDAPRLSANLRVSSAGLYHGHHLYTANESRWFVDDYDYAIECTTGTRYGIGVAPASWGKMKALFG
jgi:hypothetical protein